jgi:hypothetical protein
MENNRKRRNNRKRQNTTDDDSFGKNQKMYSHTMSKRTPYSSSSKITYEPKYHYRKNIYGEIVKGYSRLDRRIKRNDQNKKIQNIKITMKKGHVNMNNIEIEKVCLCHLEEDENKLDLVIMELSKSIKRIVDKIKND